MPTKLAELSAPSMTRSSSPLAAVNTRVGSVRQRNLHASRVPGDSVSSGIGQSVGQRSNESRLDRLFSLVRHCGQGRGRTRRPSDFQFKVHLIEVGLPGISLARVPPQRHQKHQEDWRYWTVHWTPLGGTSEARRPPRLAALHTAVCFEPDSVSSSSRPQ